MVRERKKDFYQSNRIIGFPSLIGFPLLIGFVLYFCNFFLPDEIIFHFSWSEKEKRFLLVK